MSALKATRAWLPSQRGGILRPRGGHVSLDAENAGVLERRLEKSQEPGRRRFGDTACLRFVHAHGALSSAGRIITDMEPNTSPTLPVFEHLSRPEAIERLRKVMKALTDEENCMCAAAARLGVFCQGFRRLSDEEFRQQFHWIARKRPGASREELERLVSLYHWGRQEVTGAALCCDVETREHEGCHGWNTFDNRVLEDFYLKLTGHHARIG